MADERTLAGHVRSSVPRHERTVERRLRTVKLSVTYLLPSSHPFARTVYPTGVKGRVVTLRPGGRRRQLTQMRGTATFLKTCGEAIAKEGYATGLA